MKVLFPDRIVSRHVGGNTTYARALRDGLHAHGHTTGLIPSHGHPALTMLGESLHGLRRHDDSTVLHYSADTGPLLRTRGRSVATVHGVASRWIDVARTPRQEAVWRGRVRRAISSTDRLITVSHSAARDIAEVFDVPADEIVVIHHGIDQDAFATARTVSAEVEARLPDQFLLYVGNIEPRKNLVELIGAVETLRRRGSGLPLVIAGRPAWNFAETMSRIEASPDVVHLGFVSDGDRAALMQRCTAFVFPSLYEGFGFPVLEAMAAGAPVITSPRGSLAEVAGPSWQTDRLDAVGIAAAVEDALGDTVWLADAAERGRTWATQFSWETSIARHVDVYESLL
ncbi:glycosyltransferase family 4 protein [Luteipulveratus halotolerans]|uniref:Uncharacterized protein n=1 Tax=Luteipulveratus halotolerans TaxID=1631356 RepID=A0A0L6CF84_9MICO|nr:glycosyltransferase family 1 protein [Luteipulveratus halotolerans]KNX36183.1 hypothetical protein VV01_01905 [Luteipulveratus halotolerans]